MRTPKNRVSNANKIHSHICIKCRSKLGFTDQIITHHIIRYSATRTEKSQLKHFCSNLSTAARSLTHKNLAENVILKTGELTLSRKTNTHLENHFYHFKIIVCSVT